MRQLKIDIYNDDCKKIETIIADRIDSSNIMTVIYLSRKANHSNIIRWIEEINFWSAADGLVKIYFNNNYHIEIVRC